MGNAFRMAYAAQLQRQPTFQDVIASQLQDKTTPVENNNTRITWVRHSLSQTSICSVGLMKHRRTYKLLKGRYV